MGMGSGKRICAPILCQSHEKLNGTCEPTCVLAFSNKPTREHAHINWKRAVRWHIGQASSSAERPGIGAVRWGGVSNKYYNLIGKLHMCVCVCVCVGASAFASALHTATVTRCWSIITFACTRVDHTSPSPQYHPTHGTIPGLSQHAFCAQLNAERVPGRVGCPHKFVHIGAMCIKRRNKPLPGKATLYFFLVSVCCCYD